MDVALSVVMESVPAAESTAVRVRTATAVAVSVPFARSGTSAGRDRVVDAVSPPPAVSAGLLPLPADQPTLSEPEARSSTVQVMTPVLAAFTASTAPARSARVATRPNTAVTASVPPARSLAGVRPRAVIGASVPLALSGRIRSRVALVVALSNPAAMSSRSTPAKPVRETLTESEPTAVSVDGLTRSATTEVVSLPPDGSEMAGARAA